MEKTEKSERKLAKNQNQMFYYSNQAVSGFSLGDEVLEEEFKIFDGDRVRGVVSCRVFLSSHKVLPNSGHRQGFG
jgi:hypothetical protein